MDTEIETFNKFIVAGSHDGIAIMAPPRGFIPYDEALLLAAYLVAMADGQGTHTFDEVLQAVENT